MGTIKQADLLETIESEIRAITGTPFAVSDRAAFRADVLKSQFNVVSDRIRRASALRPASLSQRETLLSLETSASEAGSDWAPDWDESITVSQASELIGAGLTAVRIARRSGSARKPAQDSADSSETDIAKLTELNWKGLLTPAQKDILRAHTEAETAAWAEAARLKWEQVSR